ncbi:MAG: hypothetical protein AAB870_01975, partial [Patescibacteria group bacterium]
IYNKDLLEEKALYIIPFFEMQYMSIGSGYRFGVYLYKARCGDKKELILYVGSRYGFIEKFSEMIAITVASTEHDNLEIGIEYHTEKRKTGTEHQWITAHTYETILFLPFPKKTKKANKRSTKIFYIDM